MQTSACFILKRKTTRSFQRITPIPTRPTNRTKCCITCTSISSSSQHGDTADCGNRLHVSFWAAYPPHAALLQRLNMPVKQNTSSQKKRGVCQFCNSVRAICEFGKKSPLCMTEYGIWKCKLYSDDVKITCNKMQLRKTIVTHAIDMYKR